MDETLLTKEQAEKTPDVVKDFTAASGLPWKLLQNKGCVVDGVIRPVHLQLSPTNRCDYGKCPWCSCSGVDRSLELGIDEISRLLAYFARLGTKALTITGGGEPTVHPHLSEILTVARANGIECGLVTNGLKWGRPVVDLGCANEALTWVRVSTVDPAGKPELNRVAMLCWNLPDVDVGVSFTVPSDVNVEFARELCVMADGYDNLTHIRFVEDILDPDAEAMNLVYMMCAGLTDKAIFQGRHEYTGGTCPCRISRLKPYVDASGYVYPCCGVQYALPDETRCMPRRTQMCHWSEFEKVAAFDGSICQKCYYEKYNVALANMVAERRHERFV